MAMCDVSRRATLDRKKAESLLFPMATFLNGGGLNKKEAMSAFSSVYDRAVRTLRARGIEYVGHTTLYADIVALWMRDKRFLDELGRPRALSLRGKNGFSTLVREIQNEANPKVVLSILVRYGNVRRIRKEKYSLVRSFFSADGRKAIAYEPYAYFLSDASVTLGRMLTATNLLRFPTPFWRKVETSELSDHLARKFSIFAKERTLTFLEELDDWLDAHKNSRRQKIKSRRRVGVGIFSIYSDPEVIDPTI